MLLLLMNRSTSRKQQLCQWSGATCTILTLHVIPACFDVHNVSLQEVIMLFKLSFFYLFSLITLPHLYSNFSPNLKPFDITHTWTCNCRRKREDAEKLCNDSYEDSLFTTLTHSLSPQFAQEVQRNWWEPNSLCFQHLLGRGIKFVYLLNK